MEREGNGRHGAQLHHVPTTHEICMGTNVGTIALSKWGWARSSLKWTPTSHARKVSKMPTVLMILTIQQSGLQARPLLGIAHLIFPTTLLKRDTCRLHFYTRGLSLREGGAWPALLRD